MAAVESGKGALSFPGRATAGAGIRPRAGSDFAETYKKIAHANKTASRAGSAEASSGEKKTTANSNDSSGSGDSRPGNPPDEVDTDRAHAVTTASSPGSEQTASDTGVASSGSEVIRQALLAISQALHLPADSDLDELLVDGTAPDTADQLANILATLKSISGILDGAASNGTALDTGDSTIDARTSADLAGVLDSQIFKIELGASMLGIGEQVGSEVAQKLAISSGGNIPQAIDPSALSMSSSQLQALLSGSASSPDALQSLVEKIAALCGSETPLNDNGEGSPESGSDDTAAQAALGTLAASMGESASPAALLGNSPGVPSYSSLDESVLQQVADKLQFAANQGISEIRIQIQPESLGEVKLRIQVEGGVVSAHVQVANQQVQKIIENNIQSLKDALSMQHLQMGSIDVNVRGETGGRSDDESADAERLPAPSTLSEIGAADGSEVEDASMRSSGLDTGRRFGNNTVEFFA
jgi:flagellar hook-length control protein FliK